MLSQIEKTHLKSSMIKINQAVIEENWPKMNNGTLSIKSACGYVGAGKIYYACYYIQKMFADSDFPGMAECYPLIVEASIEFKRYSRRIIAE